ncbi:MULTISPECIES: aminotransferase class IV [Marinobacter]|uniref:Aminodeoxychorismate lyase n=1 Tax=Marinobacter manganoxydans MnI7-9 TaxID=1094979 RepID=G6YW14_9GAMM|nr:MULTISPECIES: aminotransferase class IV [Marinobacter]EHJ03596.1 aminodeoxychorismate lyase [Marinobacter manganoxydans MnI7-9]MAK50052.1 aminodeoxychorismate lyase [Marinobacter sp.]MAM51609.1 aminodeoxychorismate lyase [Marinobacter sp.]PHS47165.1 MAG: aminodeoxychorismate lyase [Marinobacter sp.]
MFRLFWADDGGLPANDRGLAYGDGLFETIRMVEQKGVLLSRHLERMVRDAGRLGIEVSRRDLANVCVQAAQRFAGRFRGEGWILKLTLTRGSGGRGYRPAPGMEPNLLVSASPLPPMPDIAGEAVDFSKVPLSVNPVLAGIKSLNRIEQVLAAAELGPSLFEVIMADHGGNLVEGTRTNLLLRQSDGWVTPPASSLAVAGVLRQWVLERLRQQGERVSERPVAVDDVLGPDCHGLFLLNSVLGFVPVRTIAGHDLPVDGGLATIFNPLETLE